VSREAGLAAPPPEMYTSGALEHFPEKWTPVFRRKCDH
jgi:hypothetical protein